MKKAVNRGLFTGRDDGNFDPLENISRAEIAKVIINLL